MNYLLTKPRMIRNRNDYSDTQELQDEEARYEAKIQESDNNKKDEA